MFTLNVLASPFVNVKFLVPLSNDAVTKELAVTEELTNPNVLICADDDITPAGKTPLPVKLAANIFPDEDILVPSKEIFKLLPKPSCNTVIVPETNALLVPKCAND
jgi:hypothetical protein